MDKIYLVKYSTGSHSNYREIIVFATNKKSKAIKYVTKFNRILKKWKEYYSQYEENEYNVMRWIKNEYVQQYFDRWYSLYNIDRCYYLKIEFR
jgi:hypothetical protein